MLAPVAWRTPPRDYGPWELVTSLLTEGLVARGVDVTLFATADSITTATLEARDPARVRGGSRRRRARLRGAARRARDRPLRRVRPGAQPPRLAAARAGRLLARAAGHHDPRVLGAERSCPRTSRAATPSHPTTSRSRMPTGRPSLRYDATIHHGIDLAEFEARPDAPADGHLVVFGRIHPDKGTADAIEIARRAGRRLVICGPIQDAGYFASRGRARPGRRRRVPRIGRSRRALPHPGRRRGAAAPDRVRRAVRPVGRRGDGVRHAGRRVPPRLDGRGDRRRRDRLRRRRSGCGGRRGPARRGPRSRPGARDGRAPLRRRPDGRRVSRPLPAHPGPSQHAQPGT